MPSGGRFAAAEEPEPIARDIAAFFAEIGFRAQKDGVPRQMHWLPPCAGAAIVGNNLIRVSAEPPLLSGYAITEGGGALNFIVMPIK